jgi:hypothetical protein
MPNDFRAPLIKFLNFHYYQGLRSFDAEDTHLGLGLPTIARLVWGYGGTYTLTNRPDTNGVRVRLLLPTVKSDQPVVPV